VFKASSGHHPNLFLVRYGKISYYGVDVFDD
jgi:hypothetical protein